jgi:hypothetical protein
MAVAMGLFQWAHVWDAAAQRLNDAPGPSPAFQLLIAINAPLGLPRALWSRYLLGYWEYFDDAVFILAVGLFWFWIALSVHSLREQGTIVTFAWSPLRVIFDLLLFADGGFLAFFFADSILHKFAIFKQLWFLSTLVLFALWSLVLILFSARDLIDCAFQSGRPTES